MLLELLIQLLDDFNFFLGRFWHLFVIKMQDVIPLLSRFNATEACFSRFEFGLSVFGGLTVHLNLIMHHLHICRVSETHTTEIVLHGHFWNRSSGYIWLYLWLEDFFSRTLRFVAIFTPLGHIAYTHSARNLLRIWIMNKTCIELIRFSSRIIVYLHLRLI